MAIEIPVDEDAPREVATDTVDLGDGDVEAQYLKILSGAPGETSRMAVTASGALLTTGSLYANIGALPDSTAGPYADEAAVGSGVHFDSIPGGLYVIERLGLLVPGGIVPALDVLVTSGPAPGYSATDGAPVAFAFPGDAYYSATAELVEASAFSPAFGSGTTGVVARPGTTFLVRDGNNAPSAGYAASVTVVPIAAAGGFSEDVSSGLYVSILLRRIGEG